MKHYRILLLGALGLILAASQIQHVTAAGNTTGAGASGNDVPGAKAGFHMVSPLPGAEWPLATGDYANTRFSTLSQLNPGNVKSLHIVGMHLTGIPHGHEGGPVVVNNTLYMVEPFPNDLAAFDLTRPPMTLKFAFFPHPWNRAEGIACCDVVNRGGSYADGKIVYNTLDDYTHAIDARTGKEVWKTAVGDPNQGETETMAPLVIKEKNIVIVGISGGELGVRGRVTGLDLNSGKILWRAYSTGPDSDCLIGPGFKPFYKKDQGHDLGVSTWGPDQWKHGGGTVWGWLSYDPELNLFYYGTGNPGPWNEDQRPGDNKWAITVWARDPATGQAKWAYQVVPHSGWDYDQVVEPILIDMVWGGRMRKVLLHAGKNGYVFVMDRETGEVLSAEPFEPVTWSTGYDLGTGLPHMVTEKETHQGKMIPGICPANLGAKDWEPAAFSPRTGLLYIPARNTCMAYEGAPVNYIAGTPYIGAKIVNYTGPGGYQGELVAWDVVHAKKAWSIKEPEFGLNGGVLATAGDLVFYGTLDNWFRAVDARNGTVLWQVKLGSGIVSDPMTYMGPDGKQYVAVYAGVGGAMGSPDFPDISQNDPYAALGAAYAVPNIKSKTGPGGALYVFGY